MTKITLTDLVNLENQTTAVNAINTNNEIVELAFDNTLSLDGTAPNQMGANLDMNSHRILNLPAPESNYEPIRFIDANALKGGGTITVSPLPAGGTTNQLLSKVSNTDADVTWRSVGEIPTGGTAAQFLLKNSVTNFDTSWQTKGTLPIAGSTGQSLVKNSIANYDTRWSTVTGVPVGGVVNQVLRKNSAADYDIGWSYDVGNAFDPRNYGAIGDGTNNDYGAINNCIAAAVAAGGTIILNDGIYKHSGTINWAFEKLRVIAFGANVTFLHSGIGVAHSFNGMTNYPATQGCAGGVFGGPNRISIQGHATTTNAVLVDNWHFGYMKVAIKNATNACLLCQNTGIVGASAVETTFDIAISSNLNGTVTTVPLYGMLATSLASCNFERPIIEAVGNVASATPAVKLISCVGNLFNCGTVESCLAGGVTIDINSHRNTFFNMHCEVNGTGYDWLVNGYHNTFINCASGATTLGTSVTGLKNTFTGGSYDIVNVSGIAIGNTFNGCELNVTFTDSGAQTSVLNIRDTGVLFPQDYSLARLANKTIDTANAVTLRVNSKDVTDLSGTGSVLPTTVSPSFTTPSLGVATATSINKVAITAPATSATLTVPDGVTFTGPAASGTAMTLGNVEIVTGAKTFGSAGAVGKLKVAGTTSGSTILDASATASGTLTLPAATDTLVGLATTDTLTNKTLTSPKINENVALTTTATKLNFLTSATGTTGTASTNVVFSTSPTITTPTISGHPVVEGVTSTGATGTGKFVFDTSPTLVTPVLGTVAVGSVLTNATGLPISTGVSGLGANIATFLGTPSSANLASALTDEDGTGVVPFEATGTWTPTDSSGAALTFTSVNCKYTKIGNMVYAYGTFTFPATANGATVLIGGLPFTTANATYSTLPSPITNNVGVNFLVVRPVANTTTFNVYQISTAANIINSTLTSAALVVNITYPIA